MITERQEGAIVSVMAYSDDKSIVSKAITYFLLKKSELLTKPVCMTILAADTVPRELVTEAFQKVSDTWSRFNNTKLGSLLVIAGSDFIFSTHPGDYQDGGWKSGIETNRHSVTVWLSPKKHDHNAERHMFEIDTLRFLPTVDEPF